MQQLLKIEIAQGQSGQFFLRVAFKDGFQNYAVLENIQAMALGLFPGSTLQVEQADDLTFHITRVN